ncbi:MAG TPA: hypothetical protein VF669_22580 [Tepidisphaeraceae bacterium]
MNKTSLIILLLLSLCSRAQSAVPTSAPSGDYELHEWVVFVADANQSNANALSEFKATFPGFVSSRRTNADEKTANDPMPVGVIRILGDAPTSDKDKIDVLLEMKSGQFNGHWPKAESKSTRLLWKNMTAAKDAPRMGEVDPANWYKKLRDGASNYLSFNGSGDRALVYDAEIPFKMPVKVTGDGPQYKVSNTSEYTLRNLEFYKPTESGWTVALLPELKATQARPATKPATTQSTTGPATRRALSGEDAKAVFASPATAPAPASRATARTSSSSRPATQASSQPSTMPTVAITMQGADAKSIPLAGWKDRLAATGLAPIDTDLILSILQTQGSDKKRMTAVAMLEREDLDRLIPEEVVPTPRKTVRVGLVILKNIDPSILKEVDLLITQLGDNDWTKREAAQKALSELGRAAEPQLQSATKNKDIEIAYRAEKLVKTIKQGAQPNQPPH